MAYIDVDKDIKHYTDPLEERLDELEIDTEHLEKRIDELEDKLKSQMQEVDDELMTLTNQITSLLALLKAIGD